MAATRTSAKNKCIALHSVLKTYTWGKLGMDSKACELYALYHPGFVPNNSTPYAEMWLGTHSNGSAILETGDLLEDYLTAHPDVLGEAVISAFGKKLPFLLKVLSIQKPLSIQVHPDKKDAKRLHSWKPDVYKDDNHKPEMLIALSAFKAMCGFRPKDEILQHITSVPEMKSLLAEEVVLNFGKHDEHDKQGLKNVFSQMMSAPGDLVQHQIASLKERLEAKADRKDSLEELVHGLINEYPADVGVFCPYLLNVLELEEGEALFIPANEPHSYISGDGVECMAASDNVVRAGLTPKLIDKETLLSMLSYESRSPNEVKISGVRNTEFSVVFTPPVRDFAVAAINIPPKTVTFHLPKRHSASILLVVEGDAKGNDALSLRKGGSYFIPAEFDIHVHQCENSPRLLMFQAFVNVPHKCMCRNVKTD